MLRYRPENVAKLYATVEAFAKTLGSVEFVTRERYVLLRTTRIFADLVIMASAVRIAIHLHRKVEHPLFFKVVSSDRKTVTHVAKLETEMQFGDIKGFIKEAYEASLIDSPKPAAEKRQAPARRKSR